MTTIERIERIVVAVVALGTAAMIIATLLDLAK